MEQITLEGVTFHLGQKWRENDKRHPRVVEVVGWDIRLKRVQIKWVRTTWAKASRFCTYKRSHGYSPV